MVSIRVKKEKRMPKFNQMYSINLGMLHLGDLILESRAVVDQVNRPEAIKALLNKNKKKHSP